MDFELFLSFFLFSSKELLKRILKRSNENQDYLLVYFLERGYYSDAYNLTREIRNSAKWRRLRSTLLTADEHLQDRKVMMVRGIYLAVVVVVVVLLVVLLVMFLVLTVWSVHTGTYRLRL